MLQYDIDSRVEAFSTERRDSLDFPVVLPRTQIHGLNSAIIDSQSEEADTDGIDALITTLRGMRIGVKTADCVPVLLFDPTISAVAAIHSGWKGTLGNIVGITIERIETELGGCSENMKAIVGPCIHIEAFEVGNELYDKFAEAGKGKWCRRLPRFGSMENEQWHIDLPGICEAQLREAGVTQVEKRPECTFTLHDRFWSARRLGPEFSKQRILNCICLK